MKKIFILLLFTPFYLLFPSTIHAAQLSLGSEQQAFGLNQQFLVDLVLNSQGEFINAVEGEIVFPLDLVNVQEVRDGNSMINFWIEAPSVGEGAGMLRFAGITPGGYNGNNGLVFSVVFTTQKVGSGKVEIANARTLLNDGQGTAANLGVSNLEFGISEMAPDSQSLIPDSDADSTPPESFTSQLARDKNAFNNQWFVSFSAQDKGVGINHYEVLEYQPTFWGWLNKKWVVTNSPYVLKDQELKSHILVKAVDHTGNAQIEKIQPQNKLIWYELDYVWFGSGLIFVMMLMVRKQVSRRSSSKRKPTNDKQ